MLLPSSKVACVTFRTFRVASSSFRSVCARHTTYPRVFHYGQDPTGSPWWSINSSKTFVMFSVRTAVICFVWACVSVCVYVYAVERHAHRLELAIGTPNEKTTWPAHIGSNAYQTNATQSKQAATVLSKRTEKLLMRFAWWSHTDCVWLTLLLALITLCNLCARSLATTLHIAGSADLRRLHRSTRGIETSYQCRIWE